MPLAVVDKITDEFTRFAGRPPREGDLYREAPKKVLDERTGDLVAVVRCWTFTAGRWQEFTAVDRGATWAL